MNATLDPTTSALLVPFNLSEGAQELLDLIASSWTIEYYSRYMGGVSSIEIAAVTKTDRPIIHVKATGKNGGKIAMYFHVHTVDGALTLTEYDEPNVRRCSTDPKILCNVPSPC